MSVNLNLKQVNEIVDFLGGDEESEVTVQYWKEGHSGEGTYVFLSEYPEEGAVYLGLTEDQSSTLEYRRSRDNA